MPGMASSNLPDRKRGSLITWTMPALAPPDKPSQRNKSADTGRFIEKGDE